MPRLFVLHLFITLLSIVFPTASGFAQMNTMPQYDRFSFMRVMVWVESVNTLKNPHIGRFGLHLFAKDAFSNRYLVHICPQWYADNHPDQFTFKIGEQLIISGSRFATGLTENNIFAATIINCSRNNLELNVRDPYTGNALWHNQPDNLLEKIQEVQRRLFSKRSQAIQKNIKENFPVGKPSLVSQ
jgi:hypothetical protein